MTKQATKRLAPLSLRLSVEERALLERDAGRLPLSTYIKDQLLGENRPKRRRSPRVPIADHKSLARVLAMLGTSCLSQNLNQLAELAHQGSLPVDDALAENLKAACSEISIMRATLMTALGMRGETP